MKRKERYRLPPQNLEHTDPVNLGNQFNRVQTLISSKRIVSFGLYGTVAGALISEFGLLAAGIFIYLKTTRPIDHTGRWAFAVLILMFALFPLTMFLPGKLTYLATFVTLLFLPVGIWMERHRRFVVKESAKLMN